MLYDVAKWAKAREEKEKERRHFDGLSYSAKLSPARYPISLQS